MCSGRRTSRTLALVAASVVLSAGTAIGQVSAGVQGNWGSETDFGVGARIIVDLRSLVGGLETLGSFDYFFPSDDFGADLTYWEANANLVYRIDSAGKTLKPYLGAGFNFVRFEASVDVLGEEISSSETKGGLNLLGGLMFDLGTAKPFVEAKVETGGGEQLVVSAGVRF